MQDDVVGVIIKNEGSGFYGNACNCNCSYNSLQNIWLSEGTKVFKKRATQEGTEKISSVSDTKRLLVECRCEFVFIRKWGIYNGRIFYSCCYVDFICVMAMFQNIM